MAISPVMRTTLIAAGVGTTAGAAAGFALEPKTRANVEADLLIKGPLLFGALGALSTASLRGTPQFGVSVGATAALFATAGAAALSRELAS